ncbi:MAG: DUF2461 domain-containing protein [Bacteroidota bacterium]
MAFFTQDFVDFFTELKENNTKDWFDEHRKRYENSIKKPFKTFVEHMIACVHEHDQEVKIEAKAATLRINRDIRFSKDKTPYNTSMRAIISARGTKDKMYPGMYLGLGSNGVGFYGGAHMLDKENLQAVREAIVDHPDEFAALLEAADFKNKFGEVRGEKNKRLPKEFQAPAEQQPLLFNKSFYYHAELGLEAVTAEDLPDLIMAHWHAARPLQKFLLQAMGLK